MSRVKLLSGMAYDIKSYDETAMADPVLKVFGEFPAPSEPFAVNRVYKGPQGQYEEVVAIADPSGTVIFESRPRVIELRGEMFEDLFTDTFNTKVPVTSGNEHTLLFYLNGNLAAQVPLFIDAPYAASSFGATLDAAETALKKGSICWITIPQPKGAPLRRPAWYVQQGKQLFVLKGANEQELPNLENAKNVLLTVKSKDIKATIGEFDATVRVVTDPDEFDRIATLGLGTRLNLTDGEAAMQRWRDTCTLVELTPAG